MDNTAPLNYTQVIQFYRDVQAQYPNAELAATSLDAFVGGILGNSTLMAQLPRLTQEMGDTWLYGIAADPYRLSAFRELSRLRSSMEAELTRSADNKRHADSGEAVVVEAFSRRLMKIPEHNWGLSTYTYLHNYTYFLAWNNTVFGANRSNDDIRLLDYGWKEQRSYLLNTSTFLADLSVDHGGRYAGAARQMSKRVEERLQTLQPRKPDMTDWQRVVMGDDLFDTRDFVVGFDPATGAINFLLEKATNRKWATTEHHLAAFLYQTYNESNFDSFNRQYTPECVPCPDFNKIGMWASGHTERKDFRPKLLALWRRGGEDRFLLQLTLPDEAQTKYGAPAQVTVEFDFVAGRGGPAIDIKLQWFEKPATRYL